MLIDHILCALSSKRVDQQGDLGNIVFIYEQLTRLLLALTSLPSLLWRYLRTVTNFVNIAVCLSSASYPNLAFPSASNLKPFQICANLCHLSCDDNNIGLIFGVILPAFLRIPVSHKTRKTLARTKKAGARFSGAVLEHIN